MTEAGNVVAAFSEEHVQRLTGISPRQLRHWDRVGFFKPSLADESRDLPYGRVYSFLDVICLQVFNALRNEAKVPLSHLRDVKERLAHLGEKMWAKTTLYVLNRRVIFHNDDTDRKEEIVSGQGVLQITLEVVKANMKDRVRTLWERDASTVGHVQRKRNVVGNRRVIAGTRIPVTAIKSFTDAGYTVEQVKKQYPGLTEADIQAALSFDQAA